MAELKRKVAHYLLQSKAIILDPANPFTWSSGWKSPIYCDNRVTLSYPEIRNFIRNAFTDIIRTEFPESEVIAGVATGAIAQGVLVADSLKLPFIYVRPSAKDHGRQNLIEGHLKPGQKVVVVEDLVSTGGSSLKAVEALREAGAEVLGMVAIFTYGFPLAVTNFKKADLRLITLSDYPSLLSEALNTNYIAKDKLDLLEAWRTHPESWQG